MRRTIESVVGLGLMAVGVFAFLALPGRSEWVALIFVGIGGHFVSRTRTAEVLKAGIAAAKELMPLRKP